MFMDFETDSLESYISVDGVKGFFRNLEVRERIVLPVNVFVKFCVRSTDVLHSWSVPSLGLKMDATPGRLSEVGILIDRVGVYFGICSEICGLNHAFIPIIVEAVPYYVFRNWRCGFADLNFI